MLFQDKLGGWVCPTFEDKHLTIIEVNSQLAIGIELSEGLHELIEKDNMDANVAPELD